MIRRKFKEKSDEILDMLAGLSNDAAGNIACITVLSQLLLTEAIVDLEEVLRRKNGEDDVQLLDDPAQQKPQAEALGADSFDPTAPHEDLDATLSKESPINSNLKVVQGWPEHVSDLARRGN